MTVTAVPFGTDQNGKGTPLPESQWEQLWTASMTDGAINRYLLDGSGHSPLQIYALNDGPQVYAAIGVGHVQGHLLSNDSPFTLDVPANTSGVTRHDLIVGEVDVVAKTGTIKLVPGNATTGALPSLIYVSNGKMQIALAQLAVGVGVATFTTTNLTDMRQFASPQTSGWQNWNCTPQTISGSGIVIDSYGQDIARYEIAGYTCRFYVLGSIALSGTSTGGLLLPLPIQAATQFVPLRADAAGDLRRCYTAFDSNFLATYARAYPIGSGTWLVDGTSNALMFGGEYEIYH